MKRTPWKFGLESLGNKLVNVKFLVMGRAEIRFKVACLLLARLAAFGSFGVTISGVLFGQYDFEQPPISYSSTAPTDRISLLARDLESGAKSLQWDERHGWLPDLLRILEVPQSSQTLVFSKTSLQIRHITPTNPRALYYSDDAYVGWVPGGDLIELSAVDPQLGPVFFALEQAKVDRPRIRRDESQCLTCHATSKTQNVPGYLVRSVFAGQDGHPLFGLGTITTDHTTPFKDRFGGWYVTGSHGELRHRGNELAVNLPERPIDMEAGANLNHPPARSRFERYLQPSSDLVALMVLEHQSQMHNFLTRANYEARQAVRYQETMNRALDRPVDFRSDSTGRRIENAVDQLLRCLLFSQEFVLTSPIAGSSDFAREFEARGPFDSQGRSLRQFDLRTRMFRYPCSFLIYSEAFDQLPAEVLGRVRQKMAAILNGEDSSSAFQHLTIDDRRAIREILDQTKPGFLNGSAALDDSTKLN